MAIGLFDSVKGNMIHYFIRPDDNFVLNTLEELDASTYLYRLLREEGYQQIFFIDIKETNYSVLTYDQFSYWATAKPLDFSKVDLNDASAVSSFLGETGGSVKKPAGMSLNTKFNRQPIGQSPAQQAPAQKKVPVFGKTQLQTFASSEEFTAFMLNRISPAINSNKVKTAVVMPQEMFEQVGRISQTVIDGVIINTIRNAQKNNQGKTNIIVLTTSRRENLANCMDIPNFRDLHYWVPGVLRTATYQDDRVELALDVLQKEGVLVLADCICEDEIANLLLRKKLIECDPRFESLRLSKIYHLAELLAEQCRMERRHFQSFVPFRMHDYIRQLDSLLSVDRIIQEVVDKSRSLKSRRIKELTDVCAVSLERVTHQRIERSVRSQEEILSDYREAMKPFDELIGLQNVRSSIELHLNEVLAYGGKRGPGHYIFSGNPGTGKTEVARLMGNVFKSLGLLKKGHLVACKKADLVAEHIGGSAIKTRKKCMEALDGVLFVDEAYDMVNTESTDAKFKTSFDEEAYNELMAFMEDNRQQLCVIFAGYTAQMERFRTANPGMPSRIPESNVIEFSDYSPEELHEIFVMFAGHDADGSFTLSDDFSQMLMKAIGKMTKGNPREFGNARKMREMFAQCKKQAAQRFVQTGDAATKYLLMPEDMPKEYNLQVSEEALAAAMQSLNELIGLKSIKATIQELFDTQVAYGIEEGPGHYVFSGNPGTGKTEVARLMGKILKAQGLLSKGHLVECKAADLIAGFTGQTSIKVRKVCESALDGVLFVDEAYSLVNTDPAGNKYSSSFAKDVYEEIMTFMENNRHRVCVIFAGYTKEMKQFVGANPGMERRITKVIDFPDYTTAELFEIFQLFARKEGAGFTISEEFEAEIRKVIGKLAKHPGPGFGNAGMMRSLFQKSKKQAAKRYIETRDESNKYVLLAQDVPEEYNLKFSAEEYECAMAALNELIGLENVKTTLRRLLNVKLAYGGDPEPGHYIFAGNPGTGKTEVARLMGQILKAQGMLSKGHLVECKAADLVAGFIGQTARNVRSICEGALDGVLFVDEAYSLVNTDPAGGAYSSSFAKDAYEEIMTFMENNRHRVCVIFAGYTKEMRQFMDANPGMQRRIAKVIDFPDYNAEELFRIFELFVRKDERGFTMSGEFSAEIRKIIQKLTKRPDPNFGNAGAMRKLYGKCKDQAADRYMETKDEDTKYLLMLEDIPEEYNLKVSEKDLSAAMERLNELIGLENVKTTLRRLLNKKLAYGGSPEPGHYIFAGNPGTGKTEVARLMGNILKAQGILAKGHLVECQPTDLVAGFLGQTGEKTRTVCESALEGVLFIDEAYTLTGGSANQYKGDFLEAAYTELMTFMENNRHRMCVIFAGYQKEMLEFVRGNPGMDRRITATIDFPDYSADELRQIFELFANKDGFSCSDEFVSKIRTVIHNMKKTADTGFGNAGTMRKLFNSCKDRASDRFMETRDEGSKYLLLPEDIPVEYLPHASDEELKKALRELNELVGLENVKNAVNELVSMKKIYQDEQGPGHYVFTGNPGTGKTEVARKMGKIFKAMGLLSKGHVVECNEADLIAEYTGHTATKVRNVCQRALGGVLFVDEAYRLINTEPTGQVFKSPFAEEAYTEIMTFMENNRHRVCVIFAGYADLMNKFLDANDGMRSRANNIIDFPDYADDELLQILKFMAIKEGYSFAPGFDEAAMEAIAVKKLEVTGKFANAREMRNLLATFRKKLSVRMNLLYQNGQMENVEQKKFILTPEDTLVGSRNGEREDVSVAMEDLNALIGLDAVKNQIRKIKNRILYSVNPAAAIEPGHYVFAGNPGTGKTEVARLMGRIFKAIGVLPRGHVVEVSRSDLVAGYIGQTAIKTMDRCKEALGGILFVDEAYTLFGKYENDFGHEALDIILKFMEDNRKKVCVIFAGYENRMTELMDANEGFDSRIKEIIHFPDYSVEELTQILGLMARKSMLKCTEEFIAEAGGLLAHLHAQKRRNFGNAREVRKLVDRADERRADRIGMLIESGAAPDSIQRNLLTVEDLDLSYKQNTAQKTVEEPEKVAPAYHRIPEKAITALNACYESRVNWERIQLAEATDSAVLFVHTDRGEGTAFLISPDGYAITCNHVIEGTKEIHARFRMPGRPGQEDSWHKCQVVNSKSDLDIALLKLEGTNFPYLTLAPRDRVIRKGEEFLLSGYPFGRRTAKDLTTFYGYVASSEKQTDENGFVRYNINSEAKSGNSGAPIIAMSDGCVIGILLGSMNGRNRDLIEEINYMRPIWYFWEEFLEKNESGNMTISDMDTPLPRQEMSDAISIIKKASELIGLEEIKRLVVWKVYSSEDEPGHYFFIGNPGTGKSEAARFMGKAFQTIGLLAKGHVVECTKNDLIDHRENLSAQKTRAVCEQALDGVLVVDDAHDLVSYDANGEAYGMQFARESVYELIAFMEKNRQRISVIFSGYPEKMRDFVNAFPGMDSHYRGVRFPDYNSEELYQLLEHFAHRKDARLSFSEEFSREIPKTIEAMKQKLGSHFANAATMQRLLDKCLLRAAQRYYETRDEARKYLLLAEDIPSEYRTVREC